MSHQHLARIVSVIGFLSGFIIPTILYAQGLKAEDKLSLPSQCQSHCVTPYGEVLGLAKGNIPAYSNCNSQCFVQEPHQENGTYTGIKWQCVEFARRWLLHQRGVVYGDVNTASEIWNLTAVTRVADHKLLPFVSYLNGSEQLPKAGDLLIYAKEYLQTGHVAVVTEVDEHQGFLKVAEQNFLNNKWGSHFARTIPFIKKANHYWLLDAYLLGWKRVST